MKTISGALAGIAVVALTLGHAPAVAQPAIGGVADLRWTPPTVEVLAGADRYATAAAVSRAGWPNGAPAVVLASGEDYPDALSAAALAGVVGGPMLLTPHDRLDERTAQELRRLAPEAVFVVGGARAVSDAVAGEVSALGAEVERLAGPDRYSTAQAVARRVIELGGDGGTVLVASGETFADALSATSLAAAFGHPILLVSSRTDPDALAGQVAELGGTRVWVIGGSAAVPDAPLARLGGHERLAGRDRTETAVAVARRGIALGLGGRPALASGESFPDGLTGGAFAGAVRGAPLLLTARAELSPAVMGWLAEARPAAVTQFGGAAAISRLAGCQLRAGQGRSWRCAEEELSRQGYHVGRVDGVADAQTPWAVYALQKVAGLPVTGRFGEPEWRAMVQRPSLPARRPELGDHLEVDLSRQLLLAYRDGRMAHAFHISSGKPSTPTVLGSFAVYRKLDYRNASNMYKPMYFYARYAIHGYPEIPLYPASAGCVRVYDGDQDFLWPKVRMGEPVYVFR